jgi:hypothetical protein
LIRNESAWASALVILSKTTIFGILCARMRFVRAPLRRRDRNAGAANPATVETQSIAGAGGGICPQGYVLTADFASTTQA